MNAGLAKFRLVTLLSLFLFSSVYAEPENISLLREQIVRYHDSGAYLHDISTVIAQAKAYINQRVAQNNHLREKKKLAIILDIDETSLSNYRQMAKYHFAMDKKLFHQEILAANAQAIEPTLNLYKYARREGIAVFFVTGRLKTEQTATENNLHHAGYNNWAGLFLRPNKYQEKSIIPFKSGIRAQIAKEGYTIVASIGDQYSDLNGGYVEKKFKLPNPFYYLP